MPKQHIKKGDLVLVLSGRDKGKTGVVLRVYPKKQRAVVQGINMIKKHVRPSATQQGGIIEREGTIHISNLKLICPKCNRPTRTYRKKLETGFSVRICKKCGEVAERT
ncbi:50S ribosomal protein L24 [Candidatus Poribacteria bacterium]|nr:MAG: 50S ribosomal protein L24 [Candidatus Poribacteria bacterium]